ncbi:hypothetical protein [Maridesulfovibrio sp.]|uniref:hypothetical protein n=1 Tax=Maridesulfovibrio sp. TaxID=2795000 RepID=UPI003B001969
MPNSAETLDRLKEVQLRLGTLEWFFSVYCEDLGDVNMTGASVMLSDTYRELKACLKEMEKPCRRCPHA